MKFKFKDDKKNVEVDAEVEKLVDKGMDLHEKNWEKKFGARHSAKMEILSIKQKNKIENKKQNKEIIEALYDKKTDGKKVELEYDHLNKQNNQKLIFSLILSIILLGFGIGLICYGYGELNYDAHQVIDYISIFCGAVLIGIVIVFWFKNFSK